jgi:hypothetical protein
MARESEHGGTRASRGNFLLPDLLVSLLYPPKPAPPPAQQSFLLD